MIFVLPFSPSFALVSEPIDSSSSPTSSREWQTLPGLGYSRIREDSSIQRAVSGLYRRRKSNACLEVPLSPRSSDVTTIARRAKKRSRGVCPTRRYDRKDERDATAHRSRARGTLFSDVRLHVSSRANGRAGRCSLRRPAVTEDCREMRSRRVCARSKSAWADAIESMTDDTPADPPRPWMVTSCVPTSLCIPVAHDDSTMGICRRPKQRPECSL
mmetsp:Transcript_40911/g.80051  ORF Transcript_40911/g.80051 Transcript_40911/m.80051 type:complete len:215 (+) Transcript_40911:1822-2466(+)